MKKLILIPLLVAFTASALFTHVGSTYAASKNAGGGPGNSGPGDKHSPGKGNGKHPGPPK
jgi:hypothetical protein